MKKKLIKLTESDLHNIINNSVRKILKESVWYGDTQPFMDIIAAASKIRERLEYVTDDDYEPYDDCDGRDLNPELYEWAKKVESEAEDWITCNSSYSPINGGEDW